jgi:aryl-alcohol dehydrogenase-like predicted oxidoreductase
MNLSHAYGVPPPADAAEALLLRALDLGVDFFDTAALYGFGANESWSAGCWRRTAPHRAGQQGRHDRRGQAEDGVKRRVIDGRPETIRATARTACSASHRPHRPVLPAPLGLPGAHRGLGGRTGRLVREGKMRAIGLSRGLGRHAAPRARGAPDRRGADRVLAVDAQPGDRGAGRLPRAGRRLRRLQPAGARLPHGHAARRGLASTKDIRRGMPRFAPTAYAPTWRCWRATAPWPREVGCTPAQLALAWVLAQGEHITVIPGTTSIAHLEENHAAAGVHLSADQVARAGELIGRHNVAGPRYNAATQAEIDTEEFPA